jgi:two-component system cell cycle response regulator
VRQIVLSGLVFYSIVAGLGLFLKPGASGYLLIGWLVGFLFLVFSNSFRTLFTKHAENGFSFTILAVIGLNFLIQLTGGLHSPAFPLYFLLTSIAAFQRRSWAYPVAGLILVIEGLNIIISGRNDANDWYAFGGFGVSLAGVALITTHITHLIRSEAKTAKDNYAKLISDADAVDPFAGGTNVEALTEENRQASYINAAREREGAFISLIDMISELVPAHTYVLFLDDRLDGVYALRGIRSQSRDVAVAPITFRRDQGLIGICASQKKPQYLPFMVVPVNSLKYYTREVPIKSFLAVPLVQGDQVLGVIAVDSLEQDAFPREIQETLVRFIPFFNQIIEKIRISVEMDMRAKNFAALHAMSSVLSSSLEISEILEELTTQIRSAVPYDYCAFLLYDEQTEEAVITALKGYDARFTNYRFSLEQSAILTHMLREWRERRVSAIHHYPDLGDRGSGIGLFPVKDLQQPIKSLLGRPLVARDKFIGAAFFASIRTNTFTEYHRNFLDTLLNQVSMVLDNSMLHSSIRDMARTDGLTGLLNHRSFMEKLAEEYKRLDRDPRPFSILLMDIDKFKNVNDKYGHPVGDAAIKTVSKVLKDTARGSDFVARYGGEEFAVGMVDTDSKGAEQMGERIRTMLEKTAVTRLSDGELRVTISIGVSSYPSDTTNCAALLTMADDALYHAKRTGRNRVCLYRDAKDAESAPLKSSIID